MGFINTQIQTRFGGLYLFGAFFIVVSVVSVFGKFGHALQLLVTR